MCVRRDGDPGGQDLNAELANHKAGIHAGWNKSSDSETECQMKKSEESTGRDILQRRSSNLLTASGVSSSFHRVVGLFADFIKAQSWCLLLSARTPRFPIFPISRYRSATAFPHSISLCVSVWPFPILIGLVGLHFAGK